MTPRSLHSIEYDDGVYRVYRADPRWTNRRLRLGPCFPTPREAARYADALDAMPVTSPLRSSGEATTADPGVPLPASGPRVVSPEQRKPLDHPPRP